MLDEAVKTVTSAEHYRAVRGLLASAMHLPFEKGRFDALCAMHILYHLPDLAQVFGAAGVNLVTATFGPADAEALLADGLKDIKTQVLRDPYAVTSHPDLLHYLSSFPPTRDGSEDQLEQLEKPSLEKMHASGGVFHLRTQAALIIARA